MAHVRTLKRADGAKRYEVRWRQAGTFKQRTFSVKRDAERFALRMEDEIERGQSTDVYVRRGTTVRDAVEGSMAASEAKLKPRTFNSYRQSYDNHVLPTLGARRVSSITAQDVERWVAGLSASGLSPATVRNTFVALNKAMRYAVRHKHITANPCSGTELPRSTAGEAFQPRFLTPEDVEKLASELDHLPPYGLMVRFAAYTGLRAGEMAGLRIRDINLLRHEVSVVRTLQRIRGEWCVGTPKSARSTRNVPLLLPDLVSALDDFLAEHPNRHDPDAGLWPGRRPGTHGLDYSRHVDHSSWMRWYFKPALKRAGLGDVRFHDLRHTFASMMFAAGVDVYKVSRWMGHANISTTDSIYAHLYLTDHSNESARVQAFLSASASQLVGSMSTRQFAPVERA